jgi:hypothetical protein
MIGTPRAGTAIAVAAFVALTATACTDREEPREPMLTHAQAKERVEQLAREAGEALDPKPRLEQGDAGDAPCSGPSDDQETGEVMVENSYWLRGLEFTRNPEFFEQFTRYWKGKGYRIARENGDPASTKDIRSIVVYDPDTDFNVSLIQGVGGQLSVTAQSSCVPEP